MESTFVTKEKIMSRKIGKSSCVFLLAFLLISPLSYSSPLNHTKTVVDRLNILMCPEDPVATLTVNGTQITNMNNGIVDPSEDVTVNICADSYGQSIPNAAFSSSVSGVMIKFDVLDADNVYYDGTLPLVGFGITDDVDGLNNNEELRFPNPDFDLIDPTQAGFMHVKFTPFIDNNGDGVLDPADCVGEEAHLSLLLNPYIMALTPVYEVNFAFAESESNESPDTNDSELKEEKVNTIENESVVSIYPNPVSTYLNIKVENLQEYRVDLYSSLGNLITTSTDELVDVSKYQNGTYILKVRASEGSTLKSEKIVIIK